ncbi:hypothetical protein L0F63_003334 [Massospora cicadina]|nr:hypothetical protein L0F63_003334 [Massospora cicadina]
MVVQSILLIATGTSISETRQLLLSLVVNRLEEQLALTLGSLTRASCNDVSVLASMGNLLQNHLPPVLDLILAFRSRPEVWVEAFQFLSELTKNLDLFGFASADLAPLSRFVRRLHQTYAAAFPEILRAAEMRGASDPGLALPEALEGLCHLTQLETVLGEGEAYDCVLDLVFFGVAQLFPLLTVEGLRLPDLSVGFFTLVALVAETFPRPLFELGPEFLASVMGLLTFAQEKYPFASTYCRPLPLTNALCPMSPRSSPLMPCSFWRSKPLKPRPIVRCILPPNHLVMAEHLYLQLQALLRNLMFRRFDSGCLPQASDTLLVLLLVLPVTSHPSFLTFLQSRFQELKAAVVGRWAAPGGAERLLEQLDLLFEAAQSSGKLGGGAAPSLTSAGSLIFSWPSSARLTPACSKPCDAYPSVCYSDQAKPFVVSGSVGSGWDFGYDGRLGWMGVLPPYQSETVKFAQTDIPTLA